MAFEKCVTCECHTLEETYTLIIREATAYTGLCNEYHANVACFVETKNVSLNISLSWFILLFWQGRILSIRYSYIDGAAPLFLKRLGIWAFIDSREVSCEMYNHRLFVRREKMAYVLRLKGTFMYWYFTNFYCASARSHYSSSLYYYSNWIYRACGSEVLSYDSLIYYLCYCVYFVGIGLFIELVRTVTEFFPHT